MTKRSMALLVVILVPLVFVTCTGCAGMVLKTDGTMVAYAIGKSKVQLQKIPPSQACDYTGDYLPTRGRAWIDGEYVQTTGMAKLGQPAYCESTGSGTNINVEGGNLGAGWFGAITTFLMLYFAPVASL
jgi:hypothetical protein